MREAPDSAAASSGLHLKVFPRRDLPTCCRQQQASARARVVSYRTREGASNSATQSVKARTRRGPGGFGPGLEIDQSSLPFPMMQTSRVGVRYCRTDCSLDSEARQVNLHLVIFDRGQAVERVAGQNTHFRNHFSVERNYVFQHYQTRQILQSNQNHAVAKWHVICIVLVSAAVRSQGCLIDR